MPDAHANFAYSTVATAPSPATSGTSLTVASRTGALFPAAPFNATVWPTSASPSSTNAEIVRVTAVSPRLIAYRDGATASGVSVSSLNVTIPATVVVGDVMLASLAYRSTGTTPGSLAGWTALTPTTGFGSDNIIEGTWWRVAQSGDAGSTLTLTVGGGSSTKVIAQLVAYSGCDTASPINTSDVLGSVSSGSRSVSAPTVTTTVNNCRIVEIFSGLSVAGTVNNAAGPSTQRIAVAGTVDIGGVVSDQAQSTAASTGSFSASTDNFSSGVGRTIALKPDPLAGDTFTIVRAQESTSARTVVTGDNIAATITAKTLTDAENPTRATATATTSSLAAGASDSTTTITIAVGYRLYSISTSRPARVRLYETAAQKTADLSRAQGTDPASTAGVILDYSTAAASTVYTLSPLVDGVNLEASPSSTISMTVTNNDTTTGTVTVTLVYLRTE